MAMVIMQEVKSRLCPDIFGNSTLDVFGCVDADGDGYSNLLDKFPNNPDLWQDSDDDGVTDSKLLPLIPLRPTTLMGMALVIIHSEQEQTSFLMTPANGLT